MPSNDADRALEERYLRACAKNIQWLVDRVTVAEGMEITGWAIPPDETATGTFLVGGRPFEEIEFPQPSPDLGSHFWPLPQAARARFRCRTGSADGLFRDGLARLEFCPEGESTLESRLRSWSFPNPADDSIPVPDGVRISRVIGAEDSTNYLLGGASLVDRFDTLLGERYEATLATRRRVLDWGCGSGRFARHFHRWPHVELWGTDIDPDNIRWCRENLAHGRFERLPLQPPTELPSGHFDLLVGISVFTHLSEAHQFAWLDELHRVAAPGALLLMSIQGLSQMGLYRPPGALGRQVGLQGCGTTRRDGALDEVIENDGYCLDVIHSRDYVRREWGRYFEVVEFVDGVAANQDLVVLRKAG